jgi:hypothetical protein
MTLLSLDDINNLDIVDFLDAIGVTPQKISGHNYWYLSPLPGRNEKTPSFKVNRHLNRWYDFGTKEGSTLVDFGIRYFDCTIQELREKLSSPRPQQTIVAHTPIILNDPPDQKLQVLHTYPIRSFYLLRYLWERRIPVSVAQRYCVEAQYTFGPKPYYAIGFPCDAGGYELRNKFHKYSSSPKSPTHIDNHSDDLAIFEGFFDMLTFVSIIHPSISNLPDLLVLNSISFFSTARPIMAPYRQKHLFLDNDATGDKHTREALQSSPTYIDHRPIYKGYKDLNQWACNIGKASSHPPEDQGRNSP